MKTKTIKNQELKEALATYLEPIVISVNTTRTRLGLPPVDITSRPDTEHKISYFTFGFKDGSAGYYDRIYDDRKDWNAYREGNFAGRNFYKGENFQLI